MKIKFLISVTVSFFMLHHSVDAQRKSVQKNYQGKQLQELKDRLSKGWNTWDARSVLCHVLLPESLAINLPLIKLLNTKPRAATKTGTCQLTHHYKNIGR